MILCCLFRSSRVYEENGEAPLLIGRQYISAHEVLTRKVDPSFLPIFKGNPDVHEGKLFCSFQVCFLRCGDLFQPAIKHKLMVCCCAQTGDRVVRKPAESSTASAYSRSFIRQDGASRNMDKPCPAASSKDVRLQDSDPGDSFSTCANSIFRPAYCVSLQVFTCCS